MKLLKSGQTFLLIQCYAVFYYGGGAKVSGIPQIDYQVASWEYFLQNPLSVRYRTFETSALFIYLLFFAIFELKSRHLQCELFGIPGHFEECALTHQGKIETSWRNKSCSLWIRTWRETHRSEVVMNPKQVFLSVLLFGAAGLLLFMYLQVWIEEQHTGNVQTYGLPLNENRSGNLLLRKWW